ncbi:CHASE2 domain-containing protein [Limnoraphis robusta CCNP1324]|uniref:CHASE2 domain-containing protein n=1 Tax=Limnoraphis robusta TaxID=1118279 RepID=UPI002B1F4D73|nr:CHASE2 domain-containing protein [Limnoraphis robusta]MEA5547971.1 CHASE2 domain-containing protein [Limnoraphis robusta CCNP1324]
MCLGFSEQVKNPSNVMREILKWTGGQPFLTQKLCQLVQISSSIFTEDNEAEWVGQLVQSYIIENWEYQDEPEHLRTIRDRILKNDKKIRRLLNLYSKILQQGEITVEHSTEQMELRLTGLVVSEKGKIKVYNRVCQEIFNLSWIEQTLSDLRPYMEALNAWIASGCQDRSRLLQGKALWEALTWAKGRSLSDLDYQFVNASQELRKRTFSHLLFTHTLGLITPLETFVALVLVGLSWQLSIQGFLLDTRLWVQSVYRQVTQQVPQDTPKVLMVSIDEESIKRAKIDDPRPMDRAYIAKIIDQLAALEAPVVGVDYLLDRHQPEKDAILANSLRQAVEKQGTWFVFATKKRSTGGWFEVLPEIASPNWSFNGDLRVLGAPPKYMSLVPLPDRSEQRLLPLSYLLALGYWIHNEQTEHTLQPQLDASTQLIYQLKAYFLDATGKDYATLFSPKAVVHPLTNWAYLLRQWWLHPIIDFSIPPEQVFKTVPAWQLLEQPTEIDKLIPEGNFVILIAPGGYREAGIDAEGEDNFAVPTALAYWRSQQNPPDLRPIFPGGEAHAYMVHHWINRRLVIPIPDLWMVLIAIFLSKGVTFIVSQYSFIKIKSSRLFFILLFVGTTVTYGLVSLQLYITAEILLPLFFPTVTFWTFLLLKQLRPLDEDIGI